jgi:hypothetical protein
MWRDEAVRPERRLLALAASRHGGVPRLSEVGSL